MKHRMNPTVALAKTATAARVTAPVVAGQGEGTPCCANPRPDCMDPRPDCMGMLVPGIGDKCKALSSFSAAPAKGIVTRMGQDAMRLGGEAIEPGSCAAGIRPCNPAPRNQAEWLSIADFLTLENLRSVFAARAATAGKRSAAVAARASAPALPHGNHGENKR